MADENQNQNGGAGNNAGNPASGQSGQGGGNQGTGQGTGGNQGAGGQAAGQQGAQNSGTGTAGEQTGAGGSGTGNQNAGTGGAAEGQGTGGQETAGRHGEWRTSAAVGLDGKPDEKLGKLAERYASPADVLRALASAQQKISSGAVKAGLPENPTDAEVAQYRKENDVPETADKYDMSDLGEGINIGEAQKPFLDQFAKAAHKLNVPQPVFKAMAAEYAKSEAAYIAVVQEQDSAAADATTEELRQEWGPDFKRNLNITRTFMEALPAEAREMLYSSRDPKGRLVGNNPVISKWILGLALQANPTATVVPGASSPTAAMNSIVDEIASIKKLQGDKNSEYYKGPKVTKVINGTSVTDTAKAVRMRELLVAQEAGRGR